MTGRRALWPLAVAAAVVLASAGALLSPGRPGGRAEGLPDRLPFDAAAVRDRVQYAFRPSGGALRGGAATYQVSLQRGELEVRPRHHPGGRPSGAAPGGDATPDGAALARATPGAPEVIEGAAVRFSPARLERGGAVLADGAGVATVAGPAEIEIAKGPVVERLSSRPEGLEQSWRFAARPVGRGALEVRLPVAAGTLVGETERGLHLAAGPLGLRYGHGTWIDARGTATPVPARWDRDAIVLSVPDAVLERSAYPAVLDPVLSPELQVDAPVFGPASRTATPAVAWGGTSYLVVWADRRSGTSSDVYGARVSAADGSVLDAAALAISTAADDQQRPAVAWDGTNFLVVWEDTRSGGIDLYGARVSAADGSVLDVDGIAISTAEGSQHDPAVAWDGTSYLVVWSDNRILTDPNIYGARVRTDGLVLDGTGLAISTAANSQEAPAVAWDGTNYLVVWNDWRSSGAGLYGIYGARVRTDGAVVDADGIAVSTGASLKRRPAVAWSGTTHLVVWDDNRSGTSFDIYGAQVRSSDGAVLDVDGIAVSTAAGSQLDPTVAWDGNHYLVAWTDGRSGAADVYGARVRGADGAVLDVDGIAIATGAGEQELPAVAWDGTSFLVVRADRDSFFLGTVSATRVRGADAAVLDVPGIAVATEANSETQPAVAWNGTGYLIAWADTRSGTDYDIYGARVSGADGSVLDGTALAISTAAGDQVSPAVAWDGTNYLVVWSDRRSGTSSDIYGARVSAADGSVLDVDGIAISTADGDQSRPAVAPGGASHLVVWQDHRGPRYTDVYGARVRAADGAVLDGSGLAISTGSGGLFDPSVAWDGSSFLVVWSKFSLSLLGTGIPGTGNIQGTQVRGADGALVGVRDISTAPGDQVEPAVAWDGTNHLVVWRDMRGGGSDIYGGRVRGADGAVLDGSGFAISTGPGDQRDPSVAWDGTGYLVAWTDARAGSEVHARRVRGSGVVPFPDGFPVSAPGRAAGRPGVAAAAPGRALVVHEGLIPLPTVPVVRTFARGVTLGPPPVAAPQAATTAAGTPVALTLTATAADGAPLTFAVTTPPQHGALTGTGAERTYTPAAGYDGPDQFAFVASDGPEDSEPATVSLTVTPAPVTPPAATPTPSGCGCATGGEANGPLLLMLGILFAGRRRLPRASPTRPGEVAGENPEATGRARRRLGPLAAPPASEPAEVTSHSGDGPPPTPLMRPRRGRPESLSAGYVPIKQNRVPSSGTPPRPTVQPPGDTE